MSFQRKDPWSEIHDFDLKPPRLFEFSFSPKGREKVLASVVPHATVVRLLTLFQDTQLFCRRKWRPY
jgi:hypothetical protein